MTESKIAVLYSALPPEKKQEEGFLRFLAKKYGEDYRLVWEKSDKYGNGFALRVGFDFYDWSEEERSRQVQSVVRSVGRNQKIISLLKESVDRWQPSVLPKEVGTVTAVGDGIATVGGLENATYGEILVFGDGTKGMVQSLAEKEVGCILFDSDESVGEGTAVYRTGKTAGIPVGENYLGRAVDALGSPIDGLGEIVCDEYRPVENPAPEIIDRKPVRKPLETGLLVVDSMFPIGRGQRELIIGDRQTGKTALAVDTIINQKGKDVVCIYVAIGQKNSSVVRLGETLKKYGATDYTVLMVASASEAAPLQYIAPYSGCALAEYFMEKGKDVLIIYDDLSKHAIAYRSMSLLLNRSPGREAYPGDVFYLHSRLLERSAQLSEAKGGGSVTALPIVETQAGDVSAYIPTNIISITDGQIFLEKDLFFSGQRPAVNVGLSVSRVGGDAQTQAMKKIAGTLRLDLAQYREMEVFTQFAGDLDEQTKKRLAYGQQLMRVLRQNKYSALSTEEQVLILICVLNKVFVGVSPSEVREQAMRTVRAVRQALPDVCKRIREGVLSDEDKESVLNYARTVAVTE